MDGSPAARLARALRVAAKDQALGGADLASRIERLTGTRPSSLWISRRFGNATRIKPLIKVDDDLFIIAEALGISQSELAWMLLDAIFGPDLNIAHRARRDSDVAAWIKQWRGGFTRGTLSWRRLDDLLDDYREHADFGVPLDKDVRGPHESNDAQPTSPDAL